MASFGEGEFDAACHAAVATVVFDPVINDRPTWLLRHVPDVHATLGIAHVQALVISTPPAPSTALLISHCS